MGNLNIYDVVKRDEYKFLFENEHLKNKLMFLTFGGSHSYGTNIETSDVDIRGVAFNSSTDLIGLSNFEQVIDNSTDTTVYAINKLIGLLLNCNPVIEILGGKPDSYIFFDDSGKKLVENKKLFISKKAVKAFGGYARQQLGRLENILYKDDMPEDKKNEKMLRSMISAIESFNDRYSQFDNSKLKLYIDNTDNQLYADVDFKHFPMKQLCGIANELTAISKNYNTVNTRNNKKDFAHLNKHAMHLVRLYLMCIDLLEKEDIITYRSEDREMLLDIRNGKYMNGDGSYKNEFFELLNEYEKRFLYAKENTSLPDLPDYKRVEEFVMEVNKKVIMGGF